MKKVKLTTREKVIIGVSIIVVGIVGIKMKSTIIKQATCYNNLANQICSGGAWKAEVGEKTFKLIAVKACCGVGNCAPHI